MKNKNISKKRITLGTKQFVPMFEQFLNESEEMEDEDMEMEETHGKGDEDEDMGGEEEEMEGSESSEGFDDESEEEEKEVEERIQEAYRRGLAKGKKLSKVNEGLNDAAVQAAINSIDLENPYNTDDATFIAGLNTHFPNAKWEVTSFPQTAPGYRNCSKVYKNIVPNVGPGDPGYVQGLYVIFPGRTIVEQLSISDKMKFPVLVSIENTKARESYARVSVTTDHFKNLGDPATGWTVKTLKMLFTDGFKA